MAIFVVRAPVHERSIGKTAGQKFCVYGSSFRLVTFLGFFGKATGSLGIRGLRSRTSLRLHGVRGRARTRGGARWGHLVHLLVPPFWRTADLLPLRGPVARHLTPCARLGAYEVRLVARRGHLTHHRASRCLFGDLGAFSIGCLAPRSDSAVLANGGILGAADARDTRSGHLCARPHSRATSCAADALARSLATCIVRPSGVRRTWCRSRTPAVRHRRANPRACVSEVCGALAISRT